MTKILSLLRAHNELVQAIKSVPGDISISAAEPIVTAFGNYIEAIRAEVQSERKLQTHMEDLQAELDEAALPDSAPRKLKIEGNVAVTMKNKSTAPVITQTDNSYVERPMRIFNEDGIIEGEIVN